MKTCSKCRKEKEYDNFHHCKKSSDGRYSQCKECRRAYYDDNIEARKAYDKTYKEKNKEKIAKYNKKYKANDPIGVYLTRFPSGKYVGSGRLERRRRDHLSGHSRIAKALGEKALSFDVLHRCESPKEAKSVEQLVINHYGLENLLNKQNAIKKERNKC